MTTSTRHFGLRGRFVLLTLGICLLVGGSGAMLVSGIVADIRTEMGVEYVGQYALKEKNRILNPLEKDLALSFALVNSPILQRWARNENDPVIATLAQHELENFRQQFFDQSLFFAIQGSKHFYYAEASIDTPLQPAYTMMEEKDSDRWYFSTLADDPSFDLNVDHDERLNVTKVWINTIIEDHGERLGIAGTGLTLDRFLQQVMSALEPGLSLILFDDQGAIQAHSNPAYIDENSVTKSTDEQSSIYRLLGEEVHRKQFDRMLQQLRNGEEKRVTAKLLLEGKTTLTAIVRLDPIGWNLLIAADPAYLGTHFKLTPLVILMMAALLLAMLSVIWLTNKMLLTPLSRLTKSASIMAEGNYKTRLPAHGHDEIGELTRMFNLMAGTVQEHTEHLEELVTQRTRELDNSNRQILDSIRYARLIQDSILPSEMELNKHMADHFIIWRPLTIVGGDFYFFRANENERLMAVIDCTGHGVAGAFMSMSAHSILNEITSRIMHDPAAILHEMHHRLRNLSNTEHHSAPDIGLEMGLCYWREPGEEIIFAGARIGLIHSRDGTLEVLPGERQSIGYQRAAENRNHRNHRLSLHPGQLFYLISDGILDQAGGEHGYGFGQKRLLQALSQTGGSMEQQKVFLEHELAEYQGQRPQRDDITVIGFIPIA